MRQLYLFGGRVRIYFAPSLPSSWYFENREDYWALSVGKVLVIYDRNTTLPVWRV